MLAKSLSAKTEEETHKKEIEIEIENTNFIFILRQCVQGLACNKQSAFLSAIGEAYSLAIVAALELGEKSDLRVKIWGTDIDEAALEEARKGEYAAQSLQKIDKRLLAKYFIPIDNNSYRISDKIRQMVEFKKCNLADEPPFKLLDAIFCRNVS